MKDSGSFDLGSNPRGTTTASYGKVKLVTMSREAQKREIKPKTKAQGGAK